MAKTMEIFKTAAVFLLLVPRIDSTSMEELKTENGQLKQELAQLKRIVDVLQAQMETKVDVVDFTVKLNNTEELEARVTVLEESVSDLEAGFAILTDEVDDVESDNTLQDERLNILEVEINDNEDDIDELVEITTELTTQVSNLGLDVTDLDQRVEELESGGGGSGNVTDLEERVDTLEDMTSQLTDEVSSLRDNDATQDQRIFIVEVDVQSLDRRVEDLESGGGGSGNITDLEERVETLEDVTSQLNDDVSSLEVNDVTQDERISSIEEDVTSLDQRVEDLEAGGDNGTEYEDSIFMAVLSSSVSSDQYLLIFDNDVINPGGYYSNITGLYTVPYDGIYQFFINLQADSSSDTVYLYLYVDGSAIGPHGDAFQGDLYRSVTVLLELTAGQKVHVGVYRGAYGDAEVFRTYFGGYLITPN